jgi:hypothetical protein
MTVCIATVCESGKKIVVATDRMLTFPFPTNLEFETEEQKIEELASSCIALVSGSTAYATEILENVRKELGGSLSPEVGKVLEIVKNEYTRTRMAKIDEMIISASLGGDYSRFLQKGGTLPNYLQVQSSVYQQIFMVTQQFNLNTDIIVAGIDSAGAHISVVIHPGTILSLDKLGYGTIGSGGMHATIYLSLSGQTSRKGLFETLYNAYAAKRASEKAPGVGEVTDVAIVEQGRTFRCTKPILDVLQQLFDESNKRQLPNYEPLEKIYNEEHGF